MKEVYSHYKSSVWFTIITMVAGFVYGMYAFGNVTQALGVVAIMGILGAIETSLSFDNAVVNAKVLNMMDPVWQKRFITWGMLIAVFGMRIIFPVLIVSLVGHVGMIEAVNMAIHDPQKYADTLMASHIMIAGFGGAFLFLVAFGYFFDEEKDVHWVHWIESKLAKIGQLESVGVALTLAIVMLFQYALPEDARLGFIVAGVFGIITHEIVKMLGDLMEIGQEATGMVAKAGLMSFLYLEVLDASFSFDGVLASLVITTNIFIIAGGLGIGAMFVRSMTIHLVEAGTLSEYKYLEHGAFYAIAILAGIMFASTLLHIPEIVTGILSIGLIGIAFWHSLIVNRREQQEVA